MKSLLCETARGEASGAWKEHGLFVAVCPTCSRFCVRQRGAGPGEHGGSMVCSSLCVTHESLLSDTARGEAKGAWREQRWCVSMCDTARGEARSGGIVVRSCVAGEDEVFESHMDSLLRVAHGLAASSHTRTRCLEWHMDSLPCGATRTRCFESQQELSVSSRAWVLGFESHMDSLLWVAHRFAPVWCIKR